MIKTTFFEIFRSQLINRRIRIWEGSPFWVEDVEQGFGMNHGTYHIKGGDWPHWVDMQDDIEILEDEDD